MACPYSLCATLTTGAKYRRSRSPMPDIRLPYPHPGQQTVRRQANRFNWLAAGRRWRKSTLGVAIAVEAAAASKRVLWAAPVYDQVRIAWNETLYAAQDNASFNQGTMTATFPRGGLILFRSLDDPDNARGHTADGVIIDECGSVKAEAWQEVLRPMLMDTNGWAWGVGTPRGRNWFWREWLSAQARPDSAAWQIPTVGVAFTESGIAYAPHPLENPQIPFSEITQLYHTLSEPVFRQEILAEFLEAEGLVFRKILESATATPLARGAAG